MKNKLLIITLFLTFSVAYAQNETAKEETWTSTIDWFNTNFKDGGNYQWGDSTAREIIKIDYVLKQGPVSKKRVTKI